MSVTIEQLCDAVATTLGAAASIVRTQSYDELTESYPPGDLPLMQVYPESGEQDPFSGQTAQSSFRGVTRVTEVLLHVDVPCRARSHLGLDMASVLSVVGEVVTILEAQKVKPYFGQDRIMGFRWQWQRVTFMRDGTPEVKYLGFRVLLWLKVF